MKTYFSGYGYRETKSWSCLSCNNYHTSGMDLFVDESVREHQAKCNPRTPKVYIVMEGCKYEGCGIVSIHASEDGAFAKAEEIVKTNRYRRYTKNPNSDDSSVLHRWSDETDILIITTYEVKT